MTGLLIKNFIRSKGFMIGLLLLFLSGLISLDIGKKFLERNQKIIAQTAHFQQESIERNVAFHANEMGLLLYYVRFGLVNDVPQLTGLSIGQRDINPSLHSVTIRNLEEQKYATDFMNPMYQLLGNMDFSFVLIYFFPLVIIALGFNLISEEKEEGTWSLILSQSARPLQMLRLKMLIRYASVLILLLLLLIIAQLYLSIPFDNAFRTYCLLCFLYVSFWFAVVWLVASFFQSSSQNALILLLSWVMLTIIVPASVNALTLWLYPVPEAFSTVLESRDGYHNKWDEPKEPTIAKFHLHYPHLKQFTHPVGKDYSWLWYYAMQQMGDDEAAPHAQALVLKLQKRNELSSTIGLFFPTIHTQLNLNALSLSDMSNYLRFIHQLDVFHEQKRLYFYPKIFTNHPISSENWKHFDLVHFQDKSQTNMFSMLFPMLIISALCLIYARVNFYKNKLY